MPDRRPQRSAEFSNDRARGDATVDNLDSGLGSVAVVEPLANDAPGTIYVALSADRTHAWLSALTLGPSGTEPLRVGARPLVVQARGGTHGSIGGDPLLPAYPARRPYARPRLATSP